MVRLVQIHSAVWTMVRDGVGAGGELGCLQSKFVSESFAASLTADSGSGDKPSGASCEQDERPHDGRQGRQRSPVGPRVAPPSGGINEDPYREPAADAGDDRAREI